MRRLGKTLFGIITAVMISGTVLSANSSICQAVDENLTFGEVMAAKKNTPTRPPSGSSTSPAPASPPSGSPPTRATSSTKSPPTAAKPVTNTAPAPCAAKKAETVNRKETSSPNSSTSQGSMKKTQKRAKNQTASNTTTSRKKETAACAATTTSARGKEKTDPFMRHGSMETAGSGP